MPKPIPMNDPPKGVSPDELVAFRLWQAWLEPPELVLKAAAADESIDPLTVVHPAATYATWTQLTIDQAKPWASMARRLIGQLGALAAIVDGQGDPTMCHGAGRGFPVCNPVPAAGTCWVDGCGNGR
jgi:hypothetical protein